MAGAVNSVLAGCDMNAIPLVALNVTVRNKLSMYLNPKNTVASDWTRMAEAMNYDYSEIRNFGSAENPTEKILDDWQGTVGALLDILKNIERHDILTDLKKYIEEDVKKYLKKQEQNLQIQPLQDPKVGSSIPRAREFAGITTMDDPLACWLCQAKRVKLETIVPDSNKGNVPELFDAFICYCPNDLDFVRKMIKELEQTEYRLKLCVFDRDVLPGACVWSITSELIETRCR